MANFNLDVAYNFATEKFRNKNPELMAKNSGGEYTEDAINIEYLGDNYKVNIPDGAVTLAEGGKDVDLKLQVLILHYLTEASGISLANKKISFKEVPGGNIYIEPFNKRAVIPFTKMFGEKPEAFKKVAAKMNGIPDTVGEISFTIPVFPRVPVTYILWLADDEFPASGNILFDASAINYLPTEDFAVIAQLAVFKMKALLEKM